MIHVADCLMGSGKSQSAITYMNEHQDQKFIYITPYLDEAARIKSGCRSLDFVEPSNKREEFDFKKRSHTAALIKEGRNITTTHQAFRGYTDEMLDDIRTGGYTLFIDECIEVLEKYELGSDDDIKAVLNEGYIKENDGVFTITDKEYNGVFFKDFLDKVRGRDLIRVDDAGENTAYYWKFPPKLLEAFEDVFVMTYLFEGQGLYNMFKLYDMPFEYIGVHKRDDGSFCFGDLPSYTPEYVHHLRDMIHILDNPKLNDIGDDYYALSMGWFDRGGDNLTKLKNNVYNCYNNIWGDIPADRRLWGAYKGAFRKVSGKGYTKRFLTFNARATNAYKGCDALVYIANIFMNGAEASFYRRNGIKVDQDRYALSIMIQWIWRSAIRDGKEVQIYIPSKRMRTILQNWIESFDEGGNAANV